MGDNESVILNQISQIENHYMDINNIFLKYGMYILFCSAAVAGCFHWINNCQMVSHFQVGTISLALQVLTCATQKKLRIF